MRDRRGSLRGEIERLGSKSDLWVIFEIPAEEVSERDGQHTGEQDEDFISMLSHSQSDYSLPSLLEGSRHSRRPTSLKSSCKRVDVESPLHRCHCEESADAYYYSDESNDAWSESTFSVESYTSTICYYTGDRWSPSSSRPATSTTFSTTSSTKSDEPPRAPHRYDAAKSDQTPRIPCRTRPTDNDSHNDTHEDDNDSIKPTTNITREKLDRSPRIPRRMATSSLGDDSTSTASSTSHRLGDSLSSNDRPATALSSKNASAVPLLCF